MTPVENTDLRILLENLVKEVHEWSSRNFGEQISKETNQRLGSLCPLMGMVEEVGELMHVTLKRHQGIRGYDDTVKYETNRDDAIADILIYMLDYCARERINLGRILVETWAKVQKRDWEKNKVNADKVAEGEPNVVIGKTTTLVEMAHAHRTDPVYGRELVSPRSTEALVQEGKEFRRLLMKLLPSVEQQVADNPNVRSYAETLAEVKAALG